MNEKRKLDGKWTIELLPMVSYHACYTGFPNKKPFNQRRDCFLRKNRRIYLQGKHQIAGLIEKTRQSAQNFLTRLENTR
jgi:hypothetical protein